MYVAVSGFGSARSGSDKGVTMDGRQVGVSALSSVGVSIEDCRDGTPLPLRTG